MPVITVDKSKYTSQHFKQPVVTPIKAQWDITFACNFRCSFCLTSSGKRTPDELSTDESFALIDKLHDAGVLFLTVMGGELFSRKDIIPILSYAIKKGMLLSFSTNASLIDEKIVDFLQASRSAFQYIQVSLYGDDERTYERITGSAKNFCRALKGLSLLSDRQLKVSVLIVVTKGNATRIPAYYEVAKQYPIESFRIVPKVPLGRASNDGVYEHRGAPAIWVPMIHTLRKLRETVKEDDPPIGVQARSFFGEYLQKLIGFETFSQKCTAATIQIYVDPCGRAAPCPFMQSAPGYLKEKYSHIQMENLRDKPFEEVWNSESFETFRKFYNPEHNLYEINTKCKYFRNRTCIPCVLTPCYCRYLIKAVKKVLEKEGEIPAIETQNRHSHEWRYFKGFTKNN